MTAPAIVVPRKNHQNWIIADGHGKQEPTINVWYMMSGGSNFFIFKI